jgi:hypothetical protein
MGASLTGLHHQETAPADRALLVVLASGVRAWRHTLLFVQPATLLRWHRQGVRVGWSRKARAAQY